MPFGAWLLTAAGSPNRQFRGAIDRVFRMPGSALTPRPGDDLVGRHPNGTAHLPLPLLERGGSRWDLQSRKGDLDVVPDARGPSGR